jgi:hypothetical protein
MKPLVCLSLTLMLISVPMSAQAASVGDAAEHWRITAAPSPPEVSLVEKKNPGFATALTVAAPLAIALAGLTLQQTNPGWQVDARWNALDAALVVAPLGLSAGYFYAGEPADGLLVGLFGSAAMASGLYFSHGGTVSGTFDPQAATIWPLLVAAGVVLFAGAFAASDVADLINQKNKDPKERQTL